MTSIDRIYKDHATCAKEINYLFKKLRQLYHLTNKYLNEINFVVVPNNEIEKWIRGDSGNSAAMQLKFRLYSWGDTDREFIGRGLEHEIELQLLNGNEGYFEYVKNTFANQWDYIKKFENSLSLYLNDKKEADRILYKLVETPEKFNKNIFRTAIELDMIRIFDVAELVYSKYDKAYITFFKESDLLRKHITNPDFIQFNYGEANTAAIEMFYKDLRSRDRVDCTPEEFAAHFDPFASPVPTPIKWKGSDIHLATLFLGRKLPDHLDKPKFYQLELKKPIDTQLILQHFKPQSCKITDRTLASNHSNSLKRPTIRNAKEIRYTIDNLNALKS